MSTSAMRASTRFFRLMYLLRSGVGQKVDELDCLVLAADAVDTAEALDDAHRVPVDVVVHQQVAVLQVLALGDAVGGDENVDLAVLRHGFHLRPLLGAGCEVDEYLSEIRLAEGRAVGFGSAGYQCDVDTQFLARPVLHFFIEVGRRIGEGAEDDDLAVLLPMAFGRRMLDLVLDDFLELGKLGVASGVD
jgi:hypothetical protein